MKKIKIFFIFLIFCSFNLKINSQEIDKEAKTIHIFVALCDNKNQGIVKVPEKIGNGQDPENNLYWGCAYGIKTYFKRSKEWKFIKSEKLNSIVLERVVFKHITEKDTYLVADAYDGRYIKECTKDFLSASSGIEKNTIELNGKTISFVPFSEKVEGLTLEGFKYPLKDHTLVFEQSLAISNELEAEEGIISFSEGKLLLIESRD